MHCKGSERIRKVLSKKVKLFIYLNILWWCYRETKVYILLKKSPKIFLYITRALFKYESIMS